MNGNGAINGTMTEFGTPADLKEFARLKQAHVSDQVAFKTSDNGIGHDDLGRISTPNTFGIALPHDELVKQFGKNPANWRTARAQITVNGQTLQVPFIDKGPSKDLWNQGKIDVSYPLIQGLGVSGDPIQMSYVKNGGADYVKDPDGFYQEQAAIGRQLSSRTGMPGVLSGYGALTPSGGPSAYGGVPLTATPNPTPLNPQISQPGSPVASPIVPTAPAVRRATLIAPAQPIAPAINQMGGYPQPPPPAAPGLPPWGYGPPPPWGQTPG